MISMYCSLEFGLPQVSEWMGLYQCFPYFFRLPLPGDIPTSPTLQNTDFSWFCSPSAYSLSPQWPQGSSQHSGGGTTHSKTYWTTQHIRNEGIFRTDWLHNKTNGLEQHLQKQKSNTINCHHWWTGSVLDIHFHAFENGCPILTLGEKKTVITWVTVSLLEAEWMKNKCPKHFSLIRKIS